MDGNPLKQCTETTPSVDTNASQIPLSAALDLDYLPRHFTLNMRRSSAELGPNSRSRGPASFPGNATTSPQSPAQLGDTGFSPKLDVALSGPVGPNGNTKSRTYNTVPTNAVHDPVLTPTEESLQYPHRAAARSSSKNGQQSAHSAFSDPTHRKQNNETQHH